MEGDVACSSCNCVNGSSVFDVRGHHFLVTWSWPSLASMILEVWWRCTNAWYIFYIVCFVWFLLGHNMDALGKGRKCVKLCTHYFMMCAVIHGCVENLIFQCIAASWAWWWDAPISYVCSMMHQNSEQSIVCKAAALRAERHYRYMAQFFIAIY